jgi:MFS family permease
MPGFFSKERIVAPPGFNRWRVPPASVAIHLCIGSVYAWSIFNPALVRVKGVVTSAAGDWDLDQAARTFAVAIVFLGLAAAVAGKWLEKVGPRTVGIVSAICWSGGFLLGALGIELHRLWLLYLGYGVLGGCGLGLGYVSPVSTLIRWFPDRRGMAAGLAIMGFGGGAIIAVPVKEYLIREFYQAPEYLGSVETASLTTAADGRRMAIVDDHEREVVVVGPNDVAGMLVPGPQGVYVVGTGRTGVAETFCVLGVAYLVVMLIAACSYRIPAPGWQPAGWTPPSEQATARMISRHHVDIDRALVTPQFYQLWLMLCLNVTAGIGVLAVAKTMLAEVFGTTLPDIVDKNFSAQFVLWMSVFNMLGRVVWASASDYLGRKPTYTIFFALGSVLYLSIPIFAHEVSVDRSAKWLYAFCAVTMVIFTMYGGCFATIPAYLADMFGTRFVGGIHGRLLTAWSVAGVLGPEIINALRARAIDRAIHKLAATIDPKTFGERFGASIEQLDALVAKKTVTIAKLMELVPSGTVDPTSTLYNNTMYLMAGLLVLALIANLLMRPVDQKFHLEQ